MVDNIRNVPVVEIAVGIDCLPIFKSSSGQFLPLIVQMIMSF